MEVPVIIGGREAGTLRISESGLYTVFETELAVSAAELVRLWVHGGGRSACLGVMDPRGGGLRLVRRLSRRELRAFPEPIAFASDCPAPPEDEREDKNPESLHNNNEPPEEPESAPGTRTDMYACPWPAEPPEEGLHWYARPDGSLVTFDGISTLLALPAHLRAPGRNAAERTIDGKKYLVFRT